MMNNLLQVVAIKQLNRDGNQGNKEFLVEVLMLSLLHHQNLVNLVGYCADGDQRLLVYEYMPLGSLEDHLHGKTVCFFSIFVFCILVPVKFPVYGYLLLLCAVQCMLVLVFHMPIGVYAANLPCCLAPSFCQCVSFCPCALMHISMIVRHFSLPCPFVHAAGHNVPSSQ